VHGQIGGICYNRRMFTYVRETFETAEPVTEIVARWRRIVENADKTPLRGQPMYTGTVSESGFDLMRRVWSPRSISENICRGQFVPTPQGTRIELEVHVPTTVKRLLLIAVGCVLAIALLILVPIVLVTGLPPLADVPRLALGIGVMMLICLFGALLMVALFLPIYAVVVRMVASSFHWEMVTQR